MRKLKKSLSLLLAVVFTVVNFLSAVPAKAIEVTPKITFVGVEHSPLVVGDTEIFTVTSDFQGKVQYRAFLYNGLVWSELTNGYGAEVDAKTPYLLPETPAFKLGSAKLSVWVKRAGVKGTKSNSNGDFDNYFVSNLNCVNRDNANRVYADGVMDVKQEGLKITINNSDFKGLAGIAGPYKLRLHYFNPSTGEWTKNVTAYGDKIEYTFPKAGTYVLDVHVNTEKSTTWAKYLLNKNASDTKGTYEAWKLKVITVTDKVEDPEVNISENGVIYGSVDAQTPIQINKNINITGKNVLLNNVNVKGNVTVTGDFATLDNVKVEGTLVINPGESGNINLNNVTADTIEVLSGAANSVHFNNVNSKILNVNSKNLKEAVRVEIKGTTSIERTNVKSNVILDSVKGSFGNVEILENVTKTENTVEFKGNFDKNITVKTKATLKSDKDAKLAKVVIEPANNEKITLDGTFSNVEVNKPATVATTPNTTIVNVTTNSPTTLELGSGSVVTTLDQGGQTVVLPGQGTIGNKVNPPAPPVPPTPPTPPIDPPTYVGSIAIVKTATDLIVGDTLELTATLNPANATNKAVSWTSSNSEVATVTGTTGTKANVKAIKEGSTTITVTSEDGKKKATIEINVYKELNATLVINEQEVAVVVDNIAVANQAITITMFNKSDDSVVFIDQLIADQNGKCTFNTSLDLGEYYGLVKASQSSLITILDFRIGKILDEELNATVSVLGNKVTVSVNNIKAANQPITITMYNKLNNSLAFIGQAQTNSEGKVVFETVLNPGTYYGFVKAAQSALSTKFEVIAQ